jgi:RHS repeat-associated protein
MELRLDTTTRQVTGTRYYTFSGQTVAVRTTSGVSFEAADPHGTATVAIDAVSGVSTWRRSTPYGSVRGAAPTSWPDQRGFVGGTNDSTGLTHLGAREYDPTTGRFISRDPVVDSGDPQQMNGFAYSGNSPVTSSDPTGMRACYDDDCRTVINTSVRHDSSPPATCVPPIRSLDACFNSLHPNPTTPVPPACRGEHPSFSTCDKAMMMGAYAEPQPDDGTITVTVPTDDDDDPNPLGEAEFNRLIGPMAYMVGVQSFGVCVSASGSLASYAKGVAVCYGVDSVGEGYFITTSQGTNLAMVNGTVNIGIFVSDGNLKEQEDEFSTASVGVADLLAASGEVAWGTTKKGRNVHTLMLWGGVGVGEDFEVKLPRDLTRFFKELGLGPGIGTSNTTVHYTHKRPRQAFFRPGKPQP